MAAQGFLLIATFLLVLMVLARPLGSGLARLINDIPLPGTAGVERVLFRLPGVSDSEMNWKQYLCHSRPEHAGAGGAVFYVARSALSAA